MTLPPTTVITPDVIARARYILAVRAAVQRLGRGADPADIERLVTEMLEAERRKAGHK